MPYITQAIRLELTRRLPETSGELNYVITRYALAYLTKHGKCYTTLNEIVGALECAKLELYRRVAAPYEDHKREQNGDVYPNEKVQP